MGDPSGIFHARGGSLVRRMVGETGCNQDGGAIPSLCGNALDDMEGSK